MAVGRFGQFVRDAARAVPDVAVWGRLLLVQMRRVGVDSLPVALFIAAFTGVVLALQASYTFTGTVPLDRKSTRLNSSHGYISYAVFCLKKKNIPRIY